jgi:hypothetical protein
MESNINKMLNGKTVSFVGGLTVAALAILFVGLETKNAAFAQGSPVTFKSPSEAGAEVVQAAGRGDGPALAKILGPQVTALLSTGDKKADKDAMEAFVSKYNKMNRWVDMTDGSRVLYIGADNFAFPVPLAKNPSGRWYFDAVAGAQEIRARDIGRNELLTIDACAAIVNAQESYFTNVGSLHEFAERIISTSGKQDGLYWPATEITGPSPLANLEKLPRSSVGSNLSQDRLILDGYTLRILPAQGDAAPGGTRSYIVDGRMTDGFAVLATPVKYGETGIVTFMAGRDGTVYERDLGPDTVKIAASIQEFNPTEDWSPVE